MFERALNEQNTSQIYIPFNIYNNINKRLMKECGRPSKHKSVIQK